MTKELQGVHCVKSVPIRSYSGPYSVRMRGNTDQNNSEYWHFSRLIRFLLIEIFGDISVEYDMKLSLREKFSYSELFWSVFSRTRTEYEEISRPE